MKKYFIFFLMTLPVACFTSCTPEEETVHVTKDIPTDEWPDAPVTKETPRGYYDGTYYYQPYYSNQANECALVGADRGTQVINVPPIVKINGKNFYVIKIQKGAFKNNNEITSIILDKGLNFIEDEAFSGCVNLTSAVLEGYTQVIGKNAFYDCSKLRNVTFGSDVKEIGQSAFYNCRGITKLVLPDKLETLSYEAFKNCSYIEDITIGAGLKNISQFAITSEIISKLRINNLSSWCGVQGIGYLISENNKDIHLYVDGKEVTRLVIPEGTRTINSCAFKKCAFLTSVSIPNSMNKISSTAFKDCKLLTRVDISSLAAWCMMESADGLMNSTPQKALYVNGSQLKGKLVIPENVTSISAYAFCGQESITSVRIPSGVSLIGNGAFLSCNGITDMTNMAEIPQPDKGGLNSAKVVLHVVPGAKTRYANTSAWRDFKEIREDAK